VGGVSIESHEQQVENTEGVTPFVEFLGKGLLRQRKISARLASCLRMVPGMHRIQFPKGA
jgi:hypothetical protein